MTQLYEREKAFDVTVRWLPPFRSSLDAIRGIQIATPDNLMVPLGQVAKVELLEGPSNIYREDGERYTPVKFSVRGRDLEGTIKQAQATVASKIPEGYGKRLEWSGGINELREAQHRLLFIVPLTLLIVALLVYAAVRTWLDTLIVLIDIPLACLGALTALLGRARRTSRCPRRWAFFRSSASRSRMRSSSSRIFSGFATSRTGAFSRRRARPQRSASAGADDDARRHAWPHARRLVARHRERRPRSLSRSRSSAGR